MRIIGILVARCENWVIEQCLRQALRWCDGVALVSHASYDGQNETISKLQAEFPFRIFPSYWRPTKKVKLTSRYPEPDGSFVSWEQEVPTEDEAFWPEQEVRQHGLLLARKHGATHIALIDADEFITSNYIDRVRKDSEALEPGEVLEVPLYCMETLAEYRDDGSVWTNGVLSLVVRDKPELTFQPRDDGYWFHSRKPHGHGKQVTPYKWADKMGAMHIQWCNKQRVIWKHRLYALIERLQWPNRDSAQAVTNRYMQALIPPKHVSTAPLSWWEGVDVAAIEVNAWPWHKSECFKLLRKHGLDKFRGIDIMGWPTVKDLVN